MPRACSIDTSSLIVSRRDTFQACQEDQHRATHKPEIDHNEGEQAHNRMVVVIEPVGWWNMKEAEHIIHEPIILLLKYLYKHRTNGYSNHQTGKIKDRTEEMIAWE